MARIEDRLDAIGRLFFRMLGSLCVLAAIGSVAGAVWTLRNWNGRDTAIGLVMLLVFLAAMIWAASHCLSRKRTLVEALDAMEGVPLDPPRAKRPPSP